MNSSDILQTRRLRLRRFKRKDAADVQRLAGESDVADMTLNIPHPYLDGMAEDWFESLQQNENQQKTFAVTLPADDRIIGAIGLTLEHRFDRANLGYWIGKPYWSQGYCTEAAKAIVAYGFGELGLHRIHASHIRRNPGSGRVMQKIGMRYEGVQREHVKRDNRHEDLVLYGLLRSEWTDLQED